MARTVAIEGDELVIRLTGTTAVAALKRELRIPLAAVRSVSTERYDKDGLRVAGTAVPFTDIRAGRFRRDGLKTFVSFSNRAKVVTVELDRERAHVPYDLVAVEVDDPEARRSEIERRRSAV